GPSGLPTRHFLLVSHCEFLVRHRNSPFRKSAARTPPSRCFDVDLPWLGFLVLGNANRQHAVFARRLSSRDVEVSGKLQRSRELATPALSAMEAAFPLRLDLSLAGDPQGTALGLDLEVLGCNSWNFHAQHVPLAICEYVDSRVDSTARRAEI